MLDIWYMNQVRKAFCKVLCLPQADCGPWGAASWGGSAQTLGEVIIWHPDTHCSDHCLDSHHNHMIIRPCLQLMTKDDINSFSLAALKKQKSRALVPAAVLPAVTGLIRILSRFNIWCPSDKNQWYSEKLNFSVQICIILFCCYSEASETSEPSRAKRAPQTCNEVSRRAQQGRERHGLPDNFPTHPESPEDGQSAGYHYQHHYYHVDHHYES